MPKKKPSTSNRIHRNAPSKPHHVLLYSILFLAVFGVTYVIVSGFNWAPSETHVELNTANPLQGIYTGTTPCGDCPGIKTTLTLTTTPSGDPMTYTLNMEYIDRATQNTEKGKWTQSVWKDKTLITLVPQDSTQVTYYTVLNSSEIRQLDGDRNEIPAGLPFTLTKTNK